MTCMNVNEGEKEKENRNEKLMQTEHTLAECILCCTVSAFINIENH